MITINKYIKRSYILIVTLIFLFSATAFAKNLNNNISQNKDLIAKYFDIWKILLKTNNNMDESEFMKHITVLGAYVNQDTFSVEYSFNFDWFQERHIDYFNIVVLSQNRCYDNLDIKRDKHLSEEDIKLMIFKNPMCHKLGRFNVNQNLFYSSKKEAVDILNKSLIEGQCTEGELKPTSSRRDGDLYLVGRCLISRELNQCLSVSINLITGTSDVHKDVCYIIN